MQSKCIIYDTKILCITTLLRRIPNCIGFTLNSCPVLNTYAYKGNYRKDLMTLITGLNIFFVFYS